MKNDDAKFNKTNEKNQQNSLQKKEPHKLFLIVLLIIYLVTSIIITKITQVDGAFELFGNRIPYTMFMGVFSSIGNICIIFMVVFFKKMGFISSLVLVLFQLPFLFFKFFVQHIPSSLPGAFSDILTIIAVIMIYRRNRRIDKYQNTEVEFFKSQQKFSQRLFEQTATALVNAIDKKDNYSHGHSIRVAEYSEKIARMLGKDEDECYKIYYTALLHDVGKIGISNSIINKKGRLDADEYDTIKKHPEYGNEILSSISEYPYLSIGAHYHHERYDGHGYPERLKGDDIPEIARIISVADAYDAMSSNRSYRDAIPQQLVREEILKGAGTQFDPEFAKVMQKLIDLDVEYKMKERRKNPNELAGKSDFSCAEHRSEISDGMIVVPYLNKIHLKYSPQINDPDEKSSVSLILFDSLDGRVHDQEKTIRELNYFEYCEIWMDGHTANVNARKIQTNITEHKSGKNEKKRSIVYDIVAVKRKDHALVKIDDGDRTAEVIIALPDASRYVYVAVTGEHCQISEMGITRTHERIPDDFIPRIAEYISYIDKQPVGDVPNVQVDGHRTAATDGILLKNKIEFSFHTMSLPTARLIWHCPYLAIFFSKDGKVNGEDYKEYGVVRLDGEVMETGTGKADNKLEVIKNEKFAGWDFWKETNKKGYDCTVKFERNGNVITTTTENLGITVKNVTTILDAEQDIYIALTGDQCALTGIKLQSN